ncbi:hypothetical protein P43SY_009211 [Pythium insidiosum]|uniref:Down syndrome critical region protein 3 n=1 Tax=Pythium insidiosum TaxID=114742 RepID=A0AAD5M9T7_PYTIN|nr:hypothetical protein P43SY_009211 [Pythium insidiosum]
MTECLQAPELLAPAVQLASTSVPVLLTPPPSPRATKPPQLQRILTQRLLQSPTDKLQSPVSRALSAHRKRASNRSSLDIKLNRVDRIFRPHELVQGQILISSPKGFAHQGLFLKVEGSARLQLSAKSTGLFEAFYNTVPPLDLVYFHIPVAPAGKVPLGISKFPFEFELAGIDGHPLFETYHGVYVSVKYEITCNCVRGIMKSNLQKTVEFIVEVPLRDPLHDAPEDFTITPESLENVRRKSLATVPSFHITGRIHRTNCPVNLPFTGEVRFKVEFETNVVVLFEDGTMITENFPITLYR